MPGFLPWSDSFDHNLCLNIKFEAKNVHFLEILFFQIFPRPPAHQKQKKILTRNVQCDTIRSKQFLNSVNMR